MLPPSNANTHRPQVIPGKTWVATLFSILFFAAYAVVIFTGPDQLRESFLVTREPALVSLQELAADDSRDPRHVILRGVRVESDAEKKARPKAVANIHQVHVVAGLEEGQELKLFVYCPSSILPGSEVVRDEAAGDAAAKDLRNVVQLSGILRRPNPLAYRVGAMTDDCGIPHDAWLLHLDTAPHQATLLIVGTFLLLGGLILMVMMSQNWIPNTGLSFQFLFAVVCLLGWPLRRHRDRWSVRCVYLAAGTAITGCGCWFVATGDRGLVIDAYFLEHWASAIGLWMFGIAMIMRVGWVMCRPLPETATTHAGDVLRDDKRTTKNRPITKCVVSLRSICGGVGVTLFLANFGNNLAGQPIAMLVTPVVSYAIGALFMVTAASHWLLQWLARGFCQKSYEPLKTTPRAVESYRRKCDQTLEIAGFIRKGAYRVRGSAFSTNIELHLGCNGMVVAEFLSLSGTKAIELTSLTESGICVVTSSCKPPHGKPATRWTESCYAHCAATQDLEQLLRCHLGALADLAEQHETVVAVLSQEDVTDVLKYSGRAFHDMLVQHGESSDQVGAARYGRFRFPTGLIHSDRAAADADPGGEAESAKSSQLAPC